MGDNPEKKNTKKAVKKAVKKPAAKKAAAKPATNKPKREKRDRVGGTPAFKSFVQTVAAAIRGGMESAGLTAETLAAKMKITPARVSQLLDGRPVSIRTIFDIAEACGAKAKILIG